MTRQLKLCLGHYCSLVLYYKVVSAYLGSISVNPLAPEFYI
jgi:hypothetical protein